MEIREILDPEEKKNICENILRALSDWFSVSEAVKNMIFFAAFDDDNAIGFAIMKKHNAHTNELYMMEILNDYDRVSIGKCLLQRCEQHCSKNSVHFLTVKTFDESIAEQGCEKMSLFYTAMGFEPLEVFKTFWDQDSPCLFMIKCTGNSKNF